MSETETLKSALEEIKANTGEEVILSFPLPKLYSILSLCQYAAIECRGSADYVSAEGEDFVRKVTDLLQERYPAIAASLRFGWEPEALLTREEFDQIVPFDGEITGLEPYPTDLDLL